MMPRQDIRSTVSVGASVRGVWEELIDHTDRQAELAVQGLFLRGFRAGDSRLEPLNETTNRLVIAPLPEEPTKPPRP
jgi:hypothetical protein